MKPYCVFCHAFIDESPERYEKQGNACDNCERKFNRRMFALQRREENPNKGAMRSQDYDDIRAKFFPTPPLNNDKEVLG